VYTLSLSVYLFSCSVTVVVFEPIVLLIVLFIRFGYKFNIHLLNSENISGEKAPF